MAVAATMRVTGFSAAAALIVAVASLLLLGSGQASAAGCPNEDLRTGPSAHLPDCRAYEMVTPDLGSLSPSSEIGNHGQRNNFDTWSAAPDGESLIFNTLGGIRGNPGNGSLNQYESQRSSTGWSTTATGPTSLQGGNHEFVGGSSPDHRFTLWSLETPESELGFGNYLFDRAGGPTPVGIGSLGQDLYTEGLLATPDGAHVLFATSAPRRFGIHSPVQLEPNAPPSPIEAVYDRQVGGSTKVVSLLPGEVTPQADADYQGASSDGRVAVFEINGVTYARMDNTATSAAAYPAVGSKLSCASPHNNEHTSQQWLRDGAPIAGATSDFYEVQLADEGASLQCQMRTAGGASSTSVPPTPITTTESPIAPPAPTEPLQAPTPAEPTVGTVETCTPGSWSGAPTFSYQWYSQGGPIAGATGDTYEVASGDLGSPLQCAVTGTNGDGAVTVFSAIIEAEAPAVQPAPIIDISGTQPLMSGATSLAYTVKFAGAASGSDPRIFYVGQQGDLDVVQLTSGETTQIALHGIPIQVANDGSRAYFVSTEALTGSEANSFGQTATAGEENLYLWQASGTEFVAVIDPADLSSLKQPVSVDNGRYGLEFWVQAQSPLSGVGPAVDPSRTNGDGSVLLFQSYRNLSSYDSQGHSEIYRYLAGTGQIECISCSPEGTTASADAELETLSPNISEKHGTGPWTHIPNMTPDGETVFFQTRGALLPADQDKVMDVYEWHAGQLSLISSGQSLGDNFLFGMSADAHDVFFKTYDSLTAEDTDGGSFSIYDARVDGGFPPTIPATTCEGEACQGPLTPPPPIAGSVTNLLPSSGNVAPTPHKKKHHKKNKKKHHKKKTPAKSKKSSRTGVGR